MKLLRTVLELQRGKTKTNRSRGESASRVASLPAPGRTRRCSRSELRRRRLHLWMPLHRQADRPWIMYLSFVQGMWSMSQKREVTTVVAAVPVPQHHVAGKTQNLKCWPELQPSGQRRANLHQLVAKMQRPARVGFVPIIRLI